MSRAKHRRVQESPEDRAAMRRIFAEALEGATARGWLRRVGIQPDGEMGYVSTPEGERAMQERYERQRREGQ